MSVRGWLVPGIVFSAVLIAELVLVAGAGTDIPYQDQWAVEGRQLYPTWVDGTWRPVDLIAPHNEHRIAWTRALDLALFRWNGGWDPLVQLVAGAILRAGAAGLLAGLLAKRSGGKGSVFIAIGIALAYLPHLAWQNVLWGFQSSVYFALLFSFGAFALLGSEQGSSGRRVFGLLCGAAAMFAMGPGFLVPWVLLGLVALRMIESRRFEGARIRSAWPVAILLALMLCLHRDVAAHAMLRPASLSQFAVALARAAAWPHVWTPVAAIGLNFPIAWLVVARIAGRRRAAPGEDFVLLLAGWAAAMIIAMAWTRGGSGEFDGGIPSRYADFLVLLPISNAAAAVFLMRDANVRKAWARIGAVAWAIFFVAGWIGLSAEVMSRLILPRMRDRDAPVRAMVAFQRTRDPAVFEGQPLLYVPDSNPVAVAAVLDDPRLKGKLPPSLQPREPLRSLSRAVRAVLGR